MIVIVENFSSDLKNKKRNPSSQDEEMDVTGHTKPLRYVETMNTGSQRHNYCVVQH